MIRAMRARTIIPGLLLWSASAASQTGAAEEFVAVGEWQAAADAYAAASADSDDPALWYRLGVVQAIAGDPAGAAESFGRVNELDPGFPEIAVRIAAATARAEWEAAQAADPEGFSDDPAIRAEVRGRALAERDVVASARAASGAEFGASPDLDSAEHGLLGETEEAAVDAIHALGDAPAERAHALAVADAHRRAGDLARARYFLRLYVDLGGDPALAVPVRRAIENADSPGSR
jgi:tetratricopeptide (TPR) repeat protein